MLGSRWPPSPHNGGNQAALAPTHRVADADSLRASAIADVQQMLEEFKAETKRDLSKQVDDVISQKLSGLFDKLSARMPKVDDRSARIQGELETVSRSNQPWRCQVCLVAESRSDKVAHTTRQATSSSPHHRHKALAYKHPAIQVQARHLGRTRRFSALGSRS